MVNNMTFWGLTISSIISLLLLLYICNQKNKNQLQRIFMLDVVLVFFWNIGILLQNQFSTHYSIEPYVFEYFVYVFACFLPVAIFFTGLIFANTKIKFKKSYWLLFVIPFISLIMVWTNNYHHLFYIKYSTNMGDTISGPFANVYVVYNMILYAIGLIYLVRYSIKNSGFFSKQAILFTIATLVPLIPNLLGSFGIISIPVSLTPILFTVTVLLCALAVFKFDFLKVTPIALQRVVDRMSDSYLVINENNIVTDFNKTFLATFNFTSANVRNKDFCKLLEPTSTNLDELTLTLEKAKNSPETFIFERHFKSLNKHFHIEINNISNNGSFLGILILFKDITQHIEDMKTIKENQDLLVEKERLSSLGQLVGGIAHNLKTPIMSIAGAAEGLTDLTKEYDSSIDDPEVTSSDHHEIARDMTEWIEKIKTHTSYMSDIITAVKGQAVTLSEDTEDAFTIEELLKRINILMRHELKNALIELRTNTMVDASFSLKGNVNSLVQVINNLISNAIQAYNGKTNEVMDLLVEKTEHEIVISVRDYGCGMPDEVQDKLFKEMITTKGKNGTGLGLFMSYSTIRGHFNGNITFESELGKGTTFHVILPID